MPLALVATEILDLDVHDAYKMAREGKLSGTFKVGKHWFTNVPRMIKRMQFDRDSANV